MAVEEEDPKKKPKLNYESRFTNKYSSQISRGENSFNTAVSDLANPEGAGMQVQFYHIATKRYAEFPAFITSFNDSFTSNWDQTETIGRMDPIMNFRNTTRNMSLGLEVPAVSREEAKSNLAEINRLIQFLYPTYTSNGSAKTMNGSPLVKVQFKNLISSAKNITKNSAPLENLQLDAKEQGLICAITSLSATPDFEAGAFGQIDLVEVNTANVDNGFTRKPEGAGMNFPKLWRIELSLNVIHDHSLDSNFKNAAGFPYGLGDRDKVNKDLAEKRKEWTTEADAREFFRDALNAELEKKAGQPGTGQEEVANKIKKVGQQGILDSQSA